MEALPRSKKYIYMSEENKQICRIVAIIYKNDKDNDFMENW